MPSPYRGRIGHWVRAVWQSAADCRRVLGTECAVGSGVAGLHSSRSPHGASGRHCEHRNGVCGFLRGKPAPPVACAVLLLLSVHPREGKVSVHTNFDRPACVHTERELEVSTWGILLSHNEARTLGHAGVCESHRP